MTSPAEVIDFRALEAGLQAAVDSERKYQRENDAKLRAVRQGASYEQFRSLVLTCHLKPIGHQDKLRGERKLPGNPVAPGNQCISVSEWKDE